MFHQDPYKIRPKRDWLIVRQDQRKSVLSSGIILPTETMAEKLHEGSGVIVRIGIGPKSKACSLEERLRILYRTYLRHAVPIDSGLKWEDGSPKEFFFMSVDDVAAVIDYELDVGVLSESKT